MGGKIWVEAEEKFFWRWVMSRSAKRLGADRARSEKSWAELAAIMQDKMGEEARRTYTGTMLFEHYFQNIETQRRSPYAAVYIREYLRKGGNFQGFHHQSGTRFLGGAASAKRNEAAKSTSGNGDHDNSERAPKTGASAAKGENHEANSFADDNADVGADEYYGDDEDESLDDDADDYNDDTDIGVNVEDDEEEESGSLIRSKQPE